MGRMNILRFLREQWTIIPKASTNETSTDSYGKTIIVTGATSGLGLEAAKQFHDLPSTTVAKLILTSKDMSKVEEAEKFVAGHNSAKSNYWANLDLTSFRSVSAFVDALGPAQGIHCLLANAALATHKYTQTPDGWESALQVNYLSNVLLCILLLPNLVKASAPSAPSRLVLVSSDVHYSLSSQAFEFFRTTPNILEAASRKEYCTASVMRQRTILSKFLVISFARELASRLLPEVNIVISSVNPGFCYSKLTRETEAHFPGNIWVPLLKAAVARPAEVGGSVLVRATLMLGAHTGDGGLAEWHGRYLSSCLGVAEESDLLLGDSGEAFSRKLWDDTVSILEKIDPRIKEILQLYTVYG